MESEIKAPVTGRHVGPYPFAVVATITIRDGRLHLRLDDNYHLEFWAELTLNLDELVPAITATVNDPTPKA